MTRATFTNRALLALFTAFVVASALSESPEPAKVRITTWNLEWFPNGSAHDATPEVQAQRIAAAADQGREQSEQGAICECGSRHCASTYHFVIAVWRVKAAQFDQREVLGSHR
jgi:hypothetical protein